MNFGSYKHSMHLVRGWTMAKRYVRHLCSKLPTAWFFDLARMIVHFFFPSEVVGIYKKTGIPGIDEGENYRAS